MYIDKTNQISYDKEQFGMNPCEINAAITAVANFLYSNLSKKDFIFVNILVSELSKSMFSMELLRGVCKIEKIEEKIEEVLEE